MIRHRMRYAAAAALVATLTLAGCNKKDEATAPVTTTEPTPTAAPLPVSAPAATANISSVDLGNAVGTDKKITAAMSAFKPTDTIYAAVTTSTSDPTATVPGKLDAKWTFQDGQTVKDDSAEVQFNGAGVTDFSINSPKGFPVGKYKVAISLDGQVVQSKDFEVK